jgi:hypothetical protein
VGDDARAGLELLLQRRPQLEVGAAQQIERHDRSGRDIDGQGVLLAELDERLDPFFLRGGP